MASPNCFWVIPAACLSSKIRCPKMFFSSMKIPLDTTLFA
nr:MAG TPA: hypothetical protein [Caudoviricetes sp.]